MTPQYRRILLKLSGEALMGITVMASIKPLSVGLLPKSKKSIKWVSKSLLWLAVVTFFVV